MYKVLIIDDEEPLREAIHILGDWKGLGVSEVLEANDGKTGLEMLRRDKFDLALVDMKMPELSGSQLLQIAEQEFPELLLIVISGYNDFEYTRQAIRSKVVDYLLKPVNRGDLNSALRKAVDMLEAKRRKRSEFITQNITLNMSVPKLKEKMYLSIIERSFKSQSNEAFLPLIGADTAGSQFTAGVLRLLNLEQVRRARFREDRDLMHFAVTNVINENSGGAFEAFSFVNPKNERELIAVFTLKKGYEEDAAFHSMHQLKKAAATLKELFGIVCAGAVGATYGDYLELAGSYDMAKARLDDIDLLQLKGPLVAGGGPAVQGFKDSPSLTGRMPQIRSILESGNAAHAKSILNEFTRKWQSSAHFSLGDADRTLRELLILLGDIAGELEEAPASLRAVKNRGLAALGLSGDYSSFSQFEGLLNELMDAYAGEISRSLAGNRSGVLENIKAYIDNHYFENIKISMFTDKYFLSREYLMKLFKGKYGCGIHEYVQKVRMDKARDLLADPALKVQDISEMLGYKDKNYFSKAFRNYYDCSPSEFRTRALEAEK
ncbi:chemotaxis protein CheY [Paenibacillus sp. FSL R7-0273]|uniref:response regulator transcription factor n=1 Tax=Paenibacillus sp. FSL R7-0273 TaxID=1536772 RepID=UPI0004F7168E|nr:helix-turn-helix domain-containing protein [Paenibacillus sp. FSL R7-0273]AIQ46242.1 chemotaxis protein CheY [Paenibacillus sp. FSL R7-0273]OMF89350.1 DNA-binding response regulator [Paenibacillus sp. FSL R7-0273]